MPNDSDLESQEALILDQLNHQQRIAVIDEHKNILVLAGAGSGKTSTIIKKILYLVHVKKVPPSEILAITFTRNAKNEMIDRLISHTYPEYKKIISKKRLNKAAKEKIRGNYLKKKCKWLSNLSIMTFHGWCNSILRNYGESVFDTGFKIINTQKSTYSLQTDEEASRDESDDFIDSVDRAHEPVKAIFRDIIHKRFVGTELEEFQKYIVETFLSKSEIGNIRDPAVKYHKALDRYINYLIKAMDMFKVENKSYGDIIKLGKASKYEKIRKFYEYMDCIYPQYCNHCENKSYLDFNDLHIKVLELFEKDKKILNAIKDKYRHVLVDEFQDVNALQVQLLKSIETPQTQMFCVGDDWQSIYGWRGSDVDFILNFGRWFSNPKTIKLEINYRCGPAIVNLSNAFIRKNKRILDKKMVSNIYKGSKVRVYKSKSESKDGYQQLIDKIRQLNNAGYKEDDILVLYRLYRKLDDPYLPQLRRLFETGELSGRVLTAHRAKGLEARAVFIIGAVNYVFPRNQSSDQFLAVITPFDVEKAEDEERRLFYVAMTRAKEDLFIISEEFNESRYLKELPSDYIDLENFMELEGSSFDVEPFIPSESVTEIAQPMKVNEAAPIETILSGETDEIISPPSFVRKPTGMEKMVVRRKNPRSVHDLRKREIVFLLILVMVELWLLDISSTWAIAKYVELKLYFLGHPNIAFIIGGLVVGFAAIAVAIIFIVYGNRLEFEFNEILVPDGSYKFQPAQKCIHTLKLMLYPLKRYCDEFKYNGPYIKVSLAFTTLFLLYKFLPQILKVLPLALALLIIALPIVLMCAVLFHYIIYRKKTAFLTKTRK